MAPSIGIASSNKQVKQEEVTKMDKIRKRNEELEIELSSSLKREQELRQQLELAWDRVRVAEEAEELLCIQLGDLEADTVEQSREFHARISALMQQLSHAHLLLQSAASIS